MPTKVLYFLPGLVNGYYEKCEFDRISGFLGHILLQFCRLTLSLLRSWVLRCLHFYFYPNKRRGTFQRRTQSLLKNIELLYCKSSSCRFDGEVDRNLESCCGFCSCLNSVMLQVMADKAKVLMELANLWGEFQKIQELHW